MEAGITSANAKDPPIQATIKAFRTGHNGPYIETEHGQYGKITVSLNPQCWEDGCLPNKKDVPLMLYKSIQYKIFFKLLRNLLS